MHSQRESESHRTGLAGGDLELFPQPAQGAGTSNTIDAQFEAGPEAAAGARNALVTLEGKVDGEILDEVRLLVSELVTNSVRHSDIDRTDAVRLRLEHTPYRVRVEVYDAGQGFVPEPRDLDRSRPGGWGLYLVDRLSDRWGVDRGAFTRVWFEIGATRRGRAAEAAA